MLAEDQPQCDTAYFAGGCFWCLSPAFDALDGVVATTVGYMGGSALGQWAVNQGQ